MFGFNECKIEKSDILLRKNIEILFTETEIYNILNLMTSKLLIPCDVEKIELFFTILKGELDDDYQWEDLLVDFCTLYNIDIETIIPALKKTHIFEEIRQLRERKKNSSFVSLFI